MIKSKVLFFILLIIFLVCFGVVGYIYTEDWNLFDSFYMTIITLTTTGYQEVHPLTNEGRIFTCVLLICGFGVFAYSVTTIMSYMMSVDWVEFRRKKMEKKIEQLKDHTIICGFGRMGHIVCEELYRAHLPFVVIERQQKFKEILDKKPYFWISGDASDDEHLIHAGISDAKTLICLIDNDADGLYMALAGRNLNPDVYIIVRASSESARKKILKTGANKVILPFHTSALKIAQSVINPNVEDFLDITGVRNDSEHRLHMVDININKEGNLIGKTIRDCGLARNQLIVIGIRDKDNNFIFGPSADRIFEEGDCLVAIGNKKYFDSIEEKLYNKKGAA